MLYATGNLPAGYTLESYAINNAILSMTWGVPGGAPVYAHVLYDAALARTDEFWQKMASHVQHHVQSRALDMQSYLKGVSIHKDVALSDRPPATGETNVSFSQQGFVGEPIGPGRYDIRPVGQVGGSAGSGDGV